MKKIMLGTLIGIILSGGIVYAAVTYKAGDISYEPSDASWEVNNVNDALNNLYSDLTELENIKKLGDAEASDIAIGTTAVVQGELIEGLASTLDSLNVDILATAFSGTYYENGNQRLDITLTKDYKFIVATGSVKRTYAVGGAFYPLTSGTAIYSNTNISNGSFAQIVKNMTKGSVYSIGAGNDGTTGNYTLSVIGFY